MHKFVKKRRNLCLFCSFIKLRRYLLLSFQRLLMKNLLVFCLLFCATSFANGQSLFEIKQLGTTYTTAQINAAFLPADFCGAFFSSTRNELVLNDGAIVQLKSKQELVDAGQWNYGAFCSISDGEVYYESVWSIDPDGHLLKGFDTDKYPTVKEYIHYNNN